MKTLNLIISLAFVMTAAFASAQVATTSEPALSAGGFVSLEVVNPDGTVVRGELSTPRFPDDHMPRAACCVQPEQGKFQKNPIISAIETLASRYTSKMLVLDAGGRFVDVCDKVNFIAALNSLGVFDEIKRQYAGGVVLRLNRDTVSSAAVVCMSK